MSIGRQAMAFESLATLLFIIAGLFLIFRAHASRTPPSVYPWAVDAGARR
jgi:hypothetical protein